MLITTIKYKLKNGNQLKTAQKNNQMKEKIKMQQNM